jgi:5-formaminoimidazole-4-carboxamide-1-(beta)-D-ribofuranosyl 5'-monophosphate synthetase
MVKTTPANAALAGYDQDELTIATICSHTALQIFHGARKEGFRTLGIAKPGPREVYDSFPRGRQDEFIEVRDYKDIVSPEFQQKLLERNVVLVPHGSFVEYVGAKAVEEKLKVPMFGNLRVLDWESDRKKELQWLELSDCRVPRLYNSPSEISKPCIVKFHGAKGGKGFAIVINEKEFREFIGNVTDYTLQEFIIGTRYYFQMFYTPLNKDGFRAGEGRVELLGIDRRVESNIDELYRFGFTRSELDMAKILRSFVVTGNLPLVIRESLLPEVFGMGRRIVDTSMRLFHPGMIGPFCVETVLTDELKFYVFEISARIVAGSNLYPEGSQYTEYMFGEPMSTGRRIAREINIAKDMGMLERVIF